MWARWVVSGLAILVGGWMAFDGGRALLKGDYVTPKTGPYAGQLGPWAGLVQRLGIDPRSRGMKAFFLLYGQLWVVAAYAYAAGLPGMAGVMLGFAVGALWYLPVGTVAALVQIVVLLLAGR
jgi:hypothetical protein